MAAGISDPRQRIYTIVSQLMSSVYKVQLKQGFWGLKNKKLPTNPEQKEHPWTESGLLTETGIRVPIDDDLSYKTEYQYYAGEAIVIVSPEEYLKITLRTDKYGYRLGTKEEAKALGLTLQESQEEKESKDSADLRKEKKKSTDKKGKETPQPQKLASPEKIKIDHLIRNIQRERAARQRAKEKQKELEQELDKQRLQMQEQIKQIQRLQEQAAQMPKMQEQMAQMQKMMQQLPIQQQTPRSPTAPAGFFHKEQQEKTASEEGKTGEDSACRSQHSP